MTRLAAVEMYDALVALRMADYAVIPDDSFEAVEPTEPNAMPWWLSQSEVDALNERLERAWLARSGR